MSSSRETRVVIFCLLLVTATLAFYNPITRNQFIAFDDSNYILKNANIQSGLNWDTVKWSFATFREGNWHPLTWLSHAVDFRVFGINPAGHHYTNLILHAINAVLLFLLLRQATGLTWPSLIVGALFALHPVNVESVAWAAERKNVLSTLFFLLALHAYDRYARSGRRYLYLYLWVNIFFALSLMAKPQIVTLPFVLLLWDYWPLQRLWPANAKGAVGSVSDVGPVRSFSWLLVEKLPLFILAAADSIVTVIAQHAGRAVRTVTEVSLSSRMENIFVAYVRYMGKMVWPSRLVPMYPRSGSSLPVGQAIGAAALLILISVFVLHWRDRRYLVVGWFWFLGTLVPMIGIITVGEQSMADRYAYVPFIGLFVALVWSLNEWSHEATTTEAPSAAYRRRSAWCAVAAAVVIICFGCLTYRQLGYWHNDETLWRYTLSATEGNYMAHNNLALALVDQGRSDEAIIEFRAATALHKYPPAQILALAFYELRVAHPREAIEECESVLRAANDPNAPLDPKLQVAAWSELGQAHLQTSHYAEAGENYRNVLRLNPDDEMALVLSGMLALRQGEPNTAVTQLEHAVKINPSNVNFLLLAQTLRGAGRAEEADTASAQAGKISPDLTLAKIAAGQFLAVADVDGRR
jgi:protein O-mannosyl-transferase